MEERSIHWMLRENKEIEALKKKISRLEKTIKTLKLKK